MGRRGSLAGQSNLRSLIIFVTCLIIFYLSWTLMTPNTKIKDLYSLQQQTFHSEPGKIKAHWLEGFAGRNNHHNRGLSLDNYVNEKNNLAFVKEYAQHVHKRSMSKGDKMAPREKKSTFTKPKGLYREPNSFIIETVASMDRFVHLDLKGAAPRMSYLKLFIPLVAKLGATGLLIEYEDMFPYTGKLKNIRANNAYSLSDVVELLTLASKYNLKVMPLVQTFSHMEFVLKSEFIHLRERAFTPEVIDITQNASFALIYEIIQQILTVHSNSTHLHIGCGQAYELEKNINNATVQGKQVFDHLLFLQHVSRVANVVKDHSDDSIIPVIWDDMLRTIPLIDIKNSKLSTLVEIMVWQSSTNVPQFINKDVWIKYAALFTSVWIASAFKGATGPRQAFTEPEHYLRNQLSWLDVIAENNNHLNFKGVVLMGLQRFDHFSTLCELLPVAIPSLAVCLATMKNAGFTEKIHAQTSTLIVCREAIELTFSKNEVNLSPRATHNCRFPGHDLQFAVEQMHKNRIISSWSTDILDGWLSDYQIAHKSSNPSKLRALARSLMKESSYYLSLRKSLKQHLTAIYFEDTVNEWMEENIWERMRYIGVLKQKIKSLLQFRVWPKHSFLPPLADAGKSIKFGGSKKEKQRGMIIRSNNGKSVQYFSSIALGKRYKTQFPSQISQRLSHKTLSAALKHQLNQSYVSSSLVAGSDHNKLIDKFKVPAENSDVDEVDITRFVEDKLTDDKIELPHIANTNSMKIKEHSIRNYNKASLLSHRKMEDIISSQIPSNLNSKRDNL